MKHQVLSTIAALLCVFGSVSGKANTRIINGVAVPKGTFSEVVRARSNGAGCTATIVGPRVLISAAHCFRTDGEIEFKFGGKSYRAKGIRHPEYPGKDFDVSLGVTDEDIVGAVPATIGSTVAIGERLFLLGFGCTNAGGGGGNDDVLRMGETVATGFDSTDIITQKPGGGANCFGDSGGPTLAKENGKYRVVGINSKGNIKDTSYSAYLALKNNQRFLEDAAEDGGFDICGVTKSCEGAPADVPHFKKKAFAFTLLEGTTYEQSLSSLLDTPVKGVTWHLEPGAPSAISIKGDVLVIEGIIETRDAKMTYDVTLTAKGNGGADATLIHVVVTAPEEKAPTCAVTVTPSFVNLGESITLRMTTNGDVTAAHLDGTKVATKGAQKTITPTESGVFVAEGVVKGPGGAGSCSVRYGVK